MEHTVTKHMITYLEDNNILYDLQYGFRSKCSCETQLLTFTQDILNNPRDNRQTDVIIMDFSKVFDKVPHNGLLWKPNRGQINEWLGNFLLNRQQRVVCEGETLSREAVTSWVPQGSVIGSILLLIYINGVPDGLQSDVRLFVDDMIVYMTVSNQSDAEALQSESDLLAEWEERWQMSFHPQI